MPVHRGKQRRRIRRLELPQFQQGIDDVTLHRAFRLGVVSTEVARAEFRPQEAQKTQKPGLLFRFLWLYRLPILEILTAHFRSCTLMQKNAGCCDPIWIQVILLAEVSVD